MPQVSVIPAKTSPAPTKADNPMNAGCTNQPSAAPSRTSDPAAIRTCRSSEMAFLPRTTGRPASTQAIVPPSTLTTFEIARLEELLASLLTSTTGTADDVQRLIGRPGAGLHQRGHVELIQGDIACDLDVDLLKLDGGANVDEFDLLAFLAEFRGNACGLTTAMLMVFSCERPRYRLFLFPLWYLISSQGCYRDVQGLIAWAMSSGGEREGLF